MINTINSLIRESHEHYVGLIRLLITLSVAYVALATAIGGNFTGGYDILQKIAILLHSISILFGLWMHVFLISGPLDNIKPYIEHVEEQKLKRTSMPFRPQLSFLEKSVFRLQIITFSAAFILVTVNALFLA